MKGGIVMKKMDKALEQAEKLVNPCVTQIKEMFGELVYGIDVSSLEEVVVSALKERGLTIGTAESCTGVSALAVRRNSHSPSFA